MKIIIPMSGQGSRFLKAGYEQPKSLIRVDGKYVIEHVLDMFPGEDDVMFICNQEHLAQTNMEEILKTLRPKSTIVAVESRKKGPVYAVSQAYAYIDDTEPVMISYCDYGQDWDYETFKADLKRLSPAGAVPSYTGFHPHLLHGNLYAGVLRDSEGMMIDIKEKHRFTERPEDSYHSGGAYYFASGALMKKYFSELMEKNIHLNGEYYVSTVYELLKRDNLPVLIPEIKHFMQWGTPEDLEEYEAWSRLIHSDVGKKKLTSEIPPSREPHVIIPYPKESEEYKKSYQYWKEYFSSLW